MFGQSDTATPAPDLYSAQYTDRSWTRALGTRRQGWVNNGHQAKMVGMFIGSATSGSAAQRPDFPDNARRLEQ